jgi:hypothetical protein
MHGTQKEGEKMKKLKGLRAVKRVAEREEK